MAPSPGSFWVAGALYFADCLGMRKRMRVENGAIQFIGWMRPVPIAWAVRPRTNVRLLKIKD
jgi:hypothetical protein